MSARGLLLIPQGAVLINSIKGKDITVFLSGCDSDKTTHLPYRMTKWHGKPTLFQMTTWHTHTHNTDNHMNIISLFFFNELFSVKF